MMAEKAIKKVHAAMLDRNLMRLKKPLLLLWQN